MFIRPQTKRLFRDCLSKTNIVPVVPSDLAEISSMISIARGQLLHPQTAVQVYADTLLLNSLTILAMLRCSAFASEENRHVFEKLDGEREIWCDREWTLLRESGENTHYPIGFLQPEYVK